MPIDPSKPFVVCRPVSFVPKGTIIPPHVGVTSCVGCNGRVFITNASREVARDVGGQVVCDDCVAKADTGGMIPAMTEGQIREAVEAEKQARNN